MTHHVLHGSHVRAAYDRWAQVYDHDGNPLIALEDPAVRDATGDVHGLAVLDLGCGTGRHAVWMATAGAQVTAVDFSRARYVGWPMLVVMCLRAEAPTAGTRRHG
jgi:2-polyprenyl-3-methyl-5-hydroxy-6-metoxy-1,4-benzoquinol methylase